MNIKKNLANLKRAISLEKIAIDRELVCSMNRIEKIKNNLILEISNSINTNEVDKECLKKEFDCIIKENNINLNLALNKKKEIWQKTSQVQNTKKFIAI
jgi:hypothetical protein